MKTNPTPKELLITLMQMDEMTYGSFLMKRAEEYLHNVLILDRQGKEMLIRHRNFWIWWSRQWERRNRIMVYELDLMRFKHTEPDEELSTWLRKEFELTHSLERLKVYPNRLVLASSFVSYMDAGKFHPEKSKSHV